MATPIWSSRNVVRWLRQHGAMNVLLAALSLLPAVWAADAVFLGDPPQLIGNAVRANLTDTWATTGLIGTLGRPYGPLPTWLYQIALMLTDDAVTIVRVRASLCMAVTLFAMAWVARLVRFPAVWLFGFALSPYLLLYARGLWDNTFNIPLAALTTALVLHAVVRRVLWPLPLLIPACAAMLMVHLMSLALVAAAVVFVAGGCYRNVRAAGKRERLWIGVACGLMTIIVWRMTGPYITELFGPPAKPLLQSPAANGWWFALLSPRLLSGVWVDYFFPTGYLEHAPFAGLLAVARTITAVNFALAWIGGGLTLHGLFKRRDAVTTAGLFGLMILAAQFLLNGVTHTFGHPHYYNATWVAPAMLIGVSLDRLGRWRPVAAHTAGGVLAAALAVCSVLIALRIHTTGGTRPEPTLPGQIAKEPTIGNYGPTLGNQLAVVATVQRLGPDAMRPLEFGSVSLPLSLSLGAIYTMRQSPWPRDAGLVTTPLTVRYVKDDPWDGHIGVFVGDASAVNTTRPRH